MQLAIGVAPFVAEIAEQFSVMGSNGRDMKDIVTDGLESIAKGVAWIIDLDVEWSAKTWSVAQTCSNAVEKIETVVEGVLTVSANVVEGISTVFDTLTGKIEDSLRIAAKLPKIGAEFAKAADSIHELRESSKGKVSVEVSGIKWAEKTIREGREARRKMIDDTVSNFDAIKARGSVQDQVTNFFNGVRDKQSKAAADAARGVEAGPDLVETARLADLKEEALKLRKGLLESNPLETFRNKVIDYDKLLTLKFINPDEHVQLLGKAVINLEKNAPTQPARNPEAYTFGSREAYSAIVAYMNQGRDTKSTNPTERVAQIVADQCAIQKRQEELLKRMADGLERNRPVALNLP